jgi:phage shock protein A
MSTDANTQKGTTQDQLESQLKAAEAKLDQLKAQAKSATAGAEVKVVNELLAKKKALELEQEALKKFTGDKWNQAKASLEAQIANLTKSVNDAASKSKS